MLAKVKSSVFIDSLTLEFENALTSPVKAVLIDDKGKICCSVEAEPPITKCSYSWRGLNDLPYGVYTLELSQGSDEQKMRLVKRV
ncbi:MAG: hypothetical protein HYR66_13605 [Sphingobacteriales bacterium]|nr:hypothetical protein [Sphingobacteriales bacterium]MBI3718356.1 hypothetical protein [Sphingobacteriales bacterium]